MSTTSAIWVCDVCQLRYGSRQALRRHLGVDHEHDEREARGIAYNRLHRKCKQCDASFFKLAPFLAHKKELGHWARDKYA